MPTVSGALLTLAWLIVGGVALGLLVGWIVDWIERQIDDGPIEITLSILVPYTVYLAADEVHASGVLAVVTCGLFLSRRSARFLSPSVRIQMRSFWQSFTFVLNGLVFVLIGLQLHGIRASIREYSLPTLILDGAILSVLLILLRLMWVIPGARISHFLRVRFAHQKEPIPPFRQTFIVGWTGMRGVVSLAAALALPAILDNGLPFPHRNVIVFLTFCVIVVTLILQGVTLPPLVHALGLAGMDRRNCEEEEARRIVIEAALSHLESAKGKDNQKSSELYVHLAAHYEKRLAALPGAGGNRQQIEEENRYIELTREAMRVERHTAVRLRDEGRINDEVLRRIERELDLSESQYVLDEE